MDNTVKNAYAQLLSSGKVFTFLLYQLLKKQPVSTKGRMADPKVFFIQRFNSTVPIKHIKVQNRESVRVPSMLSQGKLSHCHLKWWKKEPHFHFG